MYSEADPPPDAGATESEQRFLSDQRECLTRAQAEFLIVAPRELRSPLTLIQGYAVMLAEMSKTGALSSPQAREMVERIVSGAWRLAETVEDILDITALQADALDLLLRPISPSELVSLVAKGLRQTLAACQQTLSVEMSENLPSIEGDITQLRQAFQHIIGSVIEQAVSDGIIIGCGLLEQKIGKPEYMHFVISIHFANLDAKNQAAFLGESWAMEVSREKEGERRASLKMAIAKGIIEAHGGRFWIENIEQSEGRHAELVFHIELPLKAARRLPVA
jgi:signal transduction histidine kinase